MNNPPDERQPVFLQCRPCGFAWIAAYLPMPVSDFAKLLKRATCPKCGQRKQIYLYEPGTVPPPPAEDTSDATPAKPAA